MYATEKVLVSSLSVLSCFGADKVP